MPATPREDLPILLRAILRQFSNLDALTLHAPPSILLPASVFPGNVLVNLTTLTTNINHSCLVPLLKRSDCRLSRITIGRCGRGQPISCPLHVFSQSSPLGGNNLRVYVEGPMSCAPHLVPHNPVEEIYLHHTADRDLLPAGQLIARAAGTLQKLQLPISRYSSPRILAPFANRLHSVKIIVFRECDEVSRLFYHTWRRSIEVVSCVPQPESQISRGRTSCCG